MKKYLSLSLLTLLLLAGCAWVNLSPEGEQVKAKTPPEVTGCREIGQTTVSLLAKVGLFNRNRKKVANELLVLGRNSAAEMGGDTVVAVSEIENGEQTFAVYNCTNP